MREQGSITSKDGKMELELDQNTYNMGAKLADQLLKKYNN